MLHPHSGNFYLYFRPSILFFWFRASNLNSKWFPAWLATRVTTGTGSKKFLPYDPILSYAMDTLQYIIDKNERIPRRGLYQQEATPDKNLPISYCPKTPKISQSFFDQQISPQPLISQV